MFVGQIVLISGGTIVPAIITVRLRNGKNISLLRNSHGFIELVCVLHLFVETATLVV